MRRWIGSLALAAFFGLLAAADAQAPSPSTARGPFDGTYRFVSSAKLNATYVTRNGRTGPCPDRRAGPLHVANGKARYTTATGYKLRGTVGPQGELELHVVAPSNSSNAGSAPIDLIQRNLNRQVGRGWGDIFVFSYWWIPHHRSVPLTTYISTWRPPHCKTTRANRASQARSPRRAVALGRFRPGPARPGADATLHHTVSRTRAAAALPSVIGGPSSRFHLARAVVRGLIFCRCNDAAL
jgi:hypothetical protein